MAVPEPRFSLGFDLGGTKLRGIVLDPADHSVLAERTVPTVFAEDALLETLITLTGDLGAAVGAGPGPGSFATAGLGAPGLVDRDGVLRYGANLPGVVDAPLAARLAERIGVPIVADNDATCAAWAEHRIGAARGHSDAVVITLGTGIGAGLIADGTLLRGRNGFAGEPGHMVIDPAGPPCPCGRRGCWERLASGTALGRMGREAVRGNRAGRVLEAAGGEVDSVRGEHVSIAARAGDTDAIEILDRFCWWVAAGIANLVALLDVEVVVISGGLAESGDLLIEPIRRHFAEQLYGVERRPRVGILTAALGSDAGAIGAALLGLDRSAPGDVQA